MEPVFSPLDEELALLPGEFTPTLVESMVRVGAWIPFEPAAKGMFNHFTKVDVSSATVRRKTEQAGQAYVAVQSAEVERLERELPPAPQGPALQQVSVDGAMVPLLHKEWAEVKTLAIGTVGEPVRRKGEWHVHTEDLSYFSRLADSETFARLATVETHRRGLETAGTVCAVNDGADWEQKFVDLHRPDAVRILDWGHASEYVVAAGQAVFGVGTAATKQWLDMQLHELKNGDSQKVLGKLRGLWDELIVQVGEGSEVLETVVASLQYLEKRQEQIRYAEFSAAGYPIGSGAVESANKLVVEARMKGAGMHWAREHVDGMVALRNIACSDRWEEAWPQINERLRQGAKERSASRRHKRRLVKEMSVELPAEVPALAGAAVEPIPEAPALMIIPEDQSTIAHEEDKPSARPRRPAANHPWRRMPFGKARMAQQHSVPPRKPDAHPRLEPALTTPPTFC